MGYAEERLELIARLRAAAPGGSLADALRLDARGLRFHVGTSLADLRVPVHVEAAVRAVVGAAVRDLFFLLALRHRGMLRQAEYDRLILLDGFDPRAARPSSFNAPSTVKSENVRKAFLEAPEMHPALDAGVLASWLGTGRPGRVLAGTLNAILRRAHAEAPRREPPEPTAYLALLAIRSFSHRALEVLKDFPVSGAVARTLQGAVAAGLVLALRLAIREAGVPGTGFGAQCDAAAGVLSWLGGLKPLWGSGLTCHGAAFAERPARLDQHVAKIAQGGTVEVVAGDIAADLVGDKELMRKAARQVALARLRADLLAVVRMSELGRVPPFTVEGFSLAQLYEAPGALERVLAAPPARKELQEKTKAVAKAATNEAARAAIEAVGAAAKAWKEENPSASVPHEQVITTWARTVASLAADAALDAAVNQAEAQLVHRQGTESEGGIETQHEGGKLYLVSLEEKPILKTRTRAPQMGHLFCDMKDFTRRTAFLKETVIADFLSREFYGPILTAAARHAQGAAHLADKGGIYLNNLLGDAVSFSGDIVALLQLAEEIRAALGSYARRLDTGASREAVGKATAAIEAQFQARRQKLDAAVKSAENARSRGILDPQSGQEPGARLRALAAEIRRMDEQRQDDIALARGEKLDAGIFVSYGAAPEVATFEDHIFGQIKVSIAEKINESARGTARNPGVRARMDALLALERGRLKKPGLVCPLTVSVSQPLSIPVPADVSLAVRRSLADGNPEAAETVLNGVVREFVGRLRTEEAIEDRGDIYNGGAAISEDALKAFIEAKGKEVDFLRQEIRVADLAPALRERFVFPSPSLRLVMAVSPEAQTLLHLFVFVGRALFRGLEKQGGLGVFEMVARENLLFTLLAQHHLPGWLAERQSGEPADTADPSGLLRSNA
ncbi:MAG TPA: hypothetical protein VMK66_06890 [Myxococcales bacterium]|nr:hypothetical protein [Myxococcales bacterium]